MGNQRQGFMRGDATTTAQPPMPRKDSFFGHVAESAALGLGFGAGTVRQGVSNAKNKVMNLGAWFREQVAAGRLTDNEVKDERENGRQFAYDYAALDKEYLEHCRVDDEAILQRQHAMYLNQTFGLMQREVMSGRSNFGAMLVHLAPTLLMMHETGGIRKNLSDYMHAQLYNTSKVLYDQNPERYAAFYEKCSKAAGYADGSGMYNAKTAALDSIKCDCVYCDQLRDHGEDAEFRNAAGQKHSAYIDKIIKASTLDGVPTDETAQQRDMCIASLVTRDPTFAALYDIYPGSANWLKAVEATGGEYGIGGLDASGKQIAAAPSDFTWPDGRHAEVRTRRDVGFYMDGIEESLDWGDDKLRSAQLKYWSESMRLDGIPEADRALCLDPNRLASMRATRELSERVKAEAEAARERADAPAEEAASKDGAEGFGTARVLNHQDLADGNVPGAKPKGFDRSQTHVASPVDLLARRQGHPAKEAPIDPVAAETQANADLAGTPLNPVAPEEKPVRVAAYWAEPETLPARAPDGPDPLSYFGDESGSDPEPEAIPLVDVGPEV